MHSGFAGRSDAAPSFQRDHTIKTLQSKINILESEVTRLQAEVRSSADALSTNFANRAAKTLAGTDTRSTKDKAASRVSRPPVQSEDVDAPVSSHSAFIILPLLCHNVSVSKR